MDELIQGLPPGARVLDLGAGRGSFRTARTDLVIVRVDLEIAPRTNTGECVAADAARLPFAAGTFELIISNHSLEHMPELESTLREIGRIAKPGAALYVAVPDAGTLTDRIYRWLGRGGGHVNAFRAPQDAVAPVERFTGLRHRATRTLFSSLSFLNAHNFTAPPPRRIIFFGNGNERFLATAVWFLRVLDRAFATRLSVYGWAFYFGDVEVPKVLEPWVNVCVRCGSGHSGDFLRQAGAVRSRPGIFDRYLCPDCGAANRFTRTSRGSTL
jgi:SAM-dependent methyltransferase